MKHGELLKMVDTRSIRTHLQHTEGNNDSLSAREQFGQAITRIIESFSQEYRDLTTDFQSELWDLAFGNRVSFEDAMLPAEILRTVTADYAFQLGYIAAQREETARQRQHHEELRPVAYHSAWTLNTRMMLQHESAFIAYVALHNRVVSEALDVLRCGGTLDDAAMCCKVDSSLKLRDMIRDEFDTYCTGLCITA